MKKIIKPIVPSDPEKAQIAVHGADQRYKDLRIENRVTDAGGNEIHLKPGARVEVTVEAVRGVTAKTDHKL